eukprot:TRINITY_DN28358_c0_g1_i3.p1 TRINITY_DN28358_c0_g1~~TRINITY_DN28358_c0_g1_i3.p1  ORF type:complete len:277 (+),score=-1.79 TRINITY_DN28358_c0_g1_i3:623-1453(+)
MFISTTIEMIISVENLWCFDIFSKVKKSSCSLFCGESFAIRYCEDYRKNTLNYFKNLQIQFKRKLKQQYINTQFFNIHVIFDYSKVSLRVVQQILWGPKSTCIFILQFCTLIVAQENWLQLLCGRIDFNANYMCELTVVYFGDYSISSFQGQSNLNVFDNFMVDKQNFFGQTPQTYFLNFGFSRKSQFVLHNNNLFQENPIFNCCFNHTKISGDVFIYCFVKTVCLQVNTVVRMVGQFNLLNSFKNGSWCQKQKLMQTGSTIKIIFRLRCVNLRAR